MYVCIHIETMNAKQTHIRVCARARASKEIYPIFFLKIDIMSCSYRNVFVSCIHVRAPSVKYHLERTTLSMVVYVLKSHHDLPNERMYTQRSFILRGKLFNAVAKFPGLSLPSKV